MGSFDLDQVLGGWQKGELILIATRPSVGKTTFATDCFVYAALHATTPVAASSSTEKALALRVLQARSRLNGHRAVPLWR